MSENNQILFDTETRKAAFEMFKIDFQMKYYAMLEALKERFRSTQISWTFLGAPFIVFTALVSAKIITISDWHSLSLSQDIPPAMFVFLGLCGLASIVPLWHFIEANSRYVRTIRILNNFRAYYVMVLAKDHQLASWDRSKELPIDTNFPKTVDLQTWAGTHIILISILNTLYIALGFSCSGGHGVAWAPFILLIVVFMVFQMYMYKSKS